MQRKRRSPSSHARPPRSGATRVRPPEAAKKDAPAKPPRRRRAPSATVAEAVALGAVTVKAWSEASAHAGQAVKDSRDIFRVPPESITVHTAPAAPPDEPLASDGLFELVSPIARRALELGLVAR